MHLIHSFSLKTYHLKCLKSAPGAFSNISHVFIKCGFGFCSEEIVKSKFNSMIGLVDRERVDAALYDDFETAKAREVCSILFCSIDCCTEIY